jgi:hypothetical protein
MCVKLMCSEMAFGDSAYCERHKKMYETIPDPGPDPYLVTEDRARNLEETRRLLLDRRGWRDKQPVGDVLEDDYSEESMP